MNAESGASPTSRTNGMLETADARRRNPTRSVVRLIFGCLVLLGVLGTATNAEATVLSSGQNIPWSYGSTGQPKCGARTSLAGHEWYQGNYRVDGYVRMACGSSPVVGLGYTGRFEVWAKRGATGTPWLCMGGSNKYLGRDTYPSYFPGVSFGMPVNSSLADLQSTCKDTHGVQADRLQVSMFISVAECRDFVCAPTTSPSAQHFFQTKFPEIQIPIAGPQPKVK